MRGPAEPGARLCWIPHHKSTTNASSKITLKTHDPQRGREDVGSREGPTEKPGSRGFKDLTDGHWLEREDSRKHGL